MRYIGDTVLMTPLLKALGKGMPHTQIDVVVNKNTHQVLSGNPFIRNTLVFDHGMSKKSLGYILGFMKRIRKQRYNTVIDLTNNDRASLFTLISGAGVRIGYHSESILRRKLCYTDVIDSVLGRIHTADHHLKAAEALGLHVDDRHPFIAVSPADISSIEKRLCAEGMEKDVPFVVIHPGARRWYKSWPPLRFAGLADTIIRKYGIRVILSGSEADKGVCAVISEIMKEQPLNLAGRVPLSEIPALIRKGVCLVGNDSAPIHIATAVKTPAIALFGPTDWKAWYPRRTHDRVLAAEFSCRPCGHSRADCPLNHDYCMSAITLESVQAAVEAALEQQNEDGDKGVWIVR